MRRLAVLAALLVAGCGGDSGRVSGPSAAATPPPSGWPAGTTPQILGGDTGQPTQAQVLLDGSPYGGQAAPAGTLLELRAAGYLTRETVVRTGETRFVLWPDSDALPAEYTRALVYAEVALEGGAGLTPLRRLSADVRSVVVEPDARLQGDAAAMAALRAGADAVSTAGFTFAIGGAGDLSVPASVNSADTGCTDPTMALARTTSRQGTIVRAELVFCSIEASHDAPVAHELGHIFGLRHSPDRADLMFPTYSVGERKQLSPRERQIMALILQRRAGNQWPDNDRALGAAAGTRTIVME